MIPTALFPYPNFRYSVACYSDRVLAKTLRLLSAYRGCLGHTRRDIERCSQRKRLIWTCWSQWKQAFDCLGLMCAEESDIRGIPYNQTDVLRFSQYGHVKVWRKPLWMGWERLHSNHRAALLQAGDVERVQRRILKWKGLDKVSDQMQEHYVNDWFDDNDFCNLNHGTERDIFAANEYLTNEGAPPLGDQYPNHYIQFNWDEQPCGDITAWPLKPGESWIRE